MRIYEVLKNDHEEVLGLLEQLLSLPDDSEQRVQVVGQIRDALIPHSRAEEAVLYNTLRESTSAKDKISHSYKEHLEAEALLRTLQAKEKLSMNWRKTAEELREALMHHIHEEEGPMFRLAQSLITEEEAVLLADAFLKLKPQVKEQGLTMTTLELATNLMPPRLAKILGGANLESRI